MDFRAGRSPDGFRDPSTLSDTSFAPLIRDGDMVVFFEGREPAGFDRMKPKTIWQCRHGAFHHDEIIGKPFGSRVFSRTTKGYVYALSPTPELWSHVVPNRTQIVQDFDQSIVIFRLDLKPGDIVVESGTGSGVMSTAIMRTIAPSGFLHSFEFNEIRATRAQEEFQENALGGLARVAHRDVCAARGDGGGFGKELDGKADAVFLDLPEPWLAVEHAKLALKPGKKVCSYSPCIEQVMKTCEALRSSGFHSVTTIEFRLRNINYTEVQLDVPDFGCNPAASAPAQPAPAVSKSDEAGAGAGGKAAGAVNGGKADGGVAVVTEAIEASSSSTASAEKDGKKASEREASGGEGSSSSSDPAAESASGSSSAAATSGEASSTPKENGAAGEPAAATPSGSDTKKRPREEEKEEAGAGVSDAGRGRNERLPSKAAIRAAEAAALGNGLSQKPPLKLVCAQPFPLMRGHTAFLTFATAPVARQLGAAATAGATAGAEVGAGEAGAGVGGEATTTAVDAGATDGEAAASVDGVGPNRGGGGDAGDMDVCSDDEGVTGGKAKGKEQQEEVETTNDEGKPAVPAVSDTTDSSSAAGR